MKSLLTALAAGPVTVFTGKSATLAIQPAAGDIAYVAHWNGDAGAVPEFDVRLRAAGSNALTGAEMFSAVLEALVVADATFTTTHAAETLTKASHGLETGDGPLYVSSSGTLPSGLAASTAYYAIKVDANTLKLALSRALAFAGSNLLLASDGSGTHTYADASDTKRAYWHSVGLLGPAADGAVTLTAAKGYSIRCRHNPDVIAYAFAGTWGSAVSTKCILTPVKEL